MSARQAFTTTLVVLATLLLAYLLFRVGQILLVLFIAIIFASTIRPWVNALSERRVPRGLAVLLIYILIFAALFGVLVVSFPPFVEMTTGLLSGELLTEPLVRFSSWLTIFGWERFRVILPVITLPDQVLAFLEQTLDSAEQRALPLAQGTILFLSQFFLVFVMAFYWLTAREPMLNLILRLSPLRMRGVVERLWNDVENTLGAYVRGQGLLMVAVGLACFVGLLILRVPYAPALAVIAGLTEAIPILGPFAGAVPAVLLALTVSWETALLVAVWYIVVQQLESHVLVPKVMERAVGLNPLLVIVALIAGGLLSGVLGAVLAVPVAGAVQVIVRSLLIDPTLQKRIQRTDDGLIIVGDDGEKELLETLVDSTQNSGGNNPPR